MQTSSLHAHRPDRRRFKEPLSMENNMTTIDQTTLPVKFEDGSIFLATLKDVPGGVARVLFVNAEFVQLHIAS